MIHLDHRRPRVRTVAILTRVTGTHVPRVFTGRRGPVVAIHTRSGHAAVIERRPCPTGRRVALIARVRAGNVICRPSCGDRIVMAAGTRPVDRRMVHLDCRRPCTCAMAVFTRVTGINVTGVLARRRGSVVAIHTRSCYAAVIERRPRPICRIVTIVAGIRTRNVVGWFSRRHRIVVATGTRSAHRRVIHLGYRRPSAGIVAAFAGIRGVDMCRTLAGRRGSVVTVDTRPRHAGMVKGRRRPVRSTMAVLTSIGAGDMVRRFARRNRIVVAAGARPAHCRVVHLHCR